MPSRIKMLSCSMLLVMTCYGWSQTCSTPGIVTRGDNYIVPIHRPLAFQAPLFPVLKVQ